MCLVFHAITRTTPYRVADVLFLPSIAPVSFVKADVRREKDNKRVELQNETILPPTWHGQNGKEQGLDSGVGGTLMQWDMKIADWLAQLIAFAKRWTGHLE